MTFVNTGIADLQKTGIRNVTGETPIDMIFAGSDNTYTGSENVINNEYIRKTVTWSATGIQSKYLVQLASTEAIGSDISSVGLIGTDILFTIDPSFIGVKTNAFDVQIEGEIIINRP